MFGPIQLPARASAKFGSIYDLEFRRELGRGAFATVYEAYHRRSNTTYAVKKFRFSQLRASDMRNIENELGIHSQLVHPHIVQYVDFVAESKAIFLVLEYMPRGNLFQYMKRHRLREDEAARIFVQVCGVLSYLHARGIILRDLKPENILIDDQLNVKICDFGWATFMDNSDYCRSVAGTYCYMAPEGLRGELQTHRTDLWSLGVLLYEMVFNREPFNGRSPNDLLEKIYYEGFTVDAGVDPQLVTLLAGLMRAEAGERMSLIAVMKSPWVLRHAGVASGEELKSSQLNFPAKPAPSDPFRTENKSKTNLKGAEIIKRNPTVAAFKTSLALEGSARPDKLGSQPIPAIPPMTSMGKKPFHNFGDILTLSRATHANNTSIFGPTKSRTPDAVKDATVAKSRPTGASFFYQASSNKQVAPETQGASTCSQPNQSLHLSKPPTARENTSMAPVVPQSPNPAASPEPSALRSKLNVTIDYTKRAASPSLIASVNNSHLEVVLADHSPDPFKSHTRPDNSVLRDIAVNRRMIFASPASKPLSVAHSPPPSHFQGFKPLLAPPGQQLPDPKRPQTPLQPPGTVTDLRQKVTFADLVYKRPAGTPEPAVLTSQRALRVDENLPMNRNLTPLHTVSHHHNVAAPYPRSESAITKPVGSMKDLPAARPVPAKAGGPGTFGKFLDSMRSIARNW